MTHRHTGTMEPGESFTRWQGHEDVNLHTAVMEVMWERDEGSTKGNGDEQDSSDNPPPFLLTSPQAKTKPDCSHGTSTAGMPCWPVLQNEQSLLPCHEYCTCSPDSSSPISALGHSCYPDVCYTAARAAQGTAAAPTAISLEEESGT